MRDLQASVLACVLLMLGVPQIHAQAESAEQHLAEARRLGQRGLEQRAIEEYERAIAAAPADWRYSYQLGEYLLGDTERWDEAARAFTAAWDKGYRRGITRHKIGLALHRLGRHEEALAELDRALVLHHESLATANERQAAHLHFQIADSHLLHDRISRVTERPGRAELYGAVAEAVRHNPDDGSLRARILDLAHLAFGDGAYDDAVRLYELALLDSSGAPLDAVPGDAFLDARTMLELAENRRSLGPIEPEYTHVLLPVFYHRVWEGRSGMRQRVSMVISERRQQAALEKLRWLGRVVESMSDGRLSTALLDAAEVTPPGREEAAESPVGPAGDAEVLAGNIDRFDTVARVFPMPVRFRAWVRVASPDLRPVRATSARRATFNISPEHPHGIWLHEFFHVLEDLAGIEPEHGYFAEERRHFPEWPGRTGNELDYYRWHFAGTLAEVGWPRLNYRLRYPVR